MTATDFTALLPLLLVAAASIVVLIQTAVRRSQAAAAGLSGLGLLASFVALFYAAGAAPVRISILLTIDSYALLAMGLILGSAFFVIVLSYNYLRIREENREEYYIVLLIATLGAMVLAAANHFVSLLLGLEVLTVSLYVMIGYLRDDLQSLEAGVKYLILAASSSAFLLFGMALIYAETGEMEFSLIAQVLQQAGVNMVYILTGTALLLVGIGFKLAVAPFHMWTPDVYEGAPAPSTAFVATVSKGAVVALLLRFVATAGGSTETGVMLAIGVIAVLSMVAGNFLALLQKNVKRLLAYSSIAHLGYVLVAIVAGGVMAAEAVFYYLVVYFVTTLGAFGLIALISPSDREQTDLDAYRGLYWRRPWLAGAFTVMLLSLAGIPLTAGFVGKFLVLTAGVGSALWTLVVLLVLNSAVSIYYYVRVVATMFARDDGAIAKGSGERLPVGGSVVLTVLTLAVFYLGVYPAPLLGLIREMVTGLF